MRGLNYDANRDKSFDFLNIGEDDIDEFDDFVWSFIYSFNLILS